MNAAHILWLQDEGSDTPPASLLSKAEQTEMQSHTLASRRRSFLLSRLLLRQLLAEILPGQDVQFERAESGRLCLASHPDWHISLSHADAAIAVMAAPCPCGVDIEKPRPARLEKVVARYFSEAEQALLAVTPKAQYPQVFFRLWTLKEASVKALGEGLAHNLARLSFSLPASEEDNPVPRLQSAEPVLQLWQQQAGAHWLAAAVTGHEALRWQCRQVAMAALQAGAKTSAQ